MTLSLTIFGQADLAGSSALSETVGIVIANATATTQAVRITITSAPSLPPSPENNDNENIGVGSLLPRSHAPPHHDANRKPASTFGAFRNDNVASPSPQASGWASLLQQLPFWASRSCSTAVAPPLINSR